MEKVTKVFIGFLALYFISLVLPAIWAPAIDACSARGLMCVDWVSAAALTGAIVAGLFALVYTLSTRREESTPSMISRKAFPQGETVHVLIWLLAIFTIYFALFIKVMVLGTIDESSVFWLMVLDNQMVMEASVAFLAAGIGSTISTSFSYLSHASSNANWEGRYTPWYILRPIQGSVLGVIFFWLMKGGILAVLPAQGGDTYLELDPVGLAGICALVGMFSRRAMIKLRETFTVIFAIDEESSNANPDSQNGPQAGSEGSNR